MKKTQQPSKSTGVSLVLGGEGEFGRVQLKLSLTHDHDRPVVIRHQIMRTPLEALQVALAGRIAWRDPEGR